MVEAAIWSRTTNRQMRVSVGICKLDKYIGLGKDSFPVQSRQKYTGLDTCVDKVILCKQGSKWMIIEYGVYSTCYR